MRFRALKLHKLEIKSNFKGGLFKNFLLEQLLTSKMTLGISERTHIFCTPFSYELGLSCDSVVEWGGVLFPPFCTYVYASDDEAADEVPGISNQSANYQLHQYLLKVKKEKSLNGQPKMLVFSLIPNPMMEQYLATIYTVNGIGFKL